VPPAAIRRAKDLVPGSVGAAEAAPVHHGWLVRAMSWSAAAAIVVASCLTGYATSQRWLHGRQASLHAVTSEACFDLDLPDDLSEPPASLRRIK
jgi:hypothetical protein